MQAQCRLIDLTIINAHAMISHKNQSIGFVENEKDTRRKKKKKEKSFGSLSIFGVKNSPSSHGLEGYYL